MVGFFQELLQDAITADTCHLTDDGRKKLASELQNWFIAARKVNSPRAEKMEEMKLKFDSFARNVQIKFTGQTKISADAGYEITTPPGDQETLRWLRYGSSWFEPHPGLIETIISYAAR